MSITAMRTAIQNFANAVKDRAVDSVVEVDGKSEADVKGALVKADFGLGNVPNYTVASDSEAFAGSIDNKLMTPQRARQTIDAAQNGFRGSNDGDVFYRNDGGALVPLDSEPYVVEMPIAETAAEFNAAQAREQSFQEVFDTWYRFSHRAAAAQPVNPDELAAWNYNAVTDQIECTVNSVTFIGFVSPDAFEEYTYEVELSSTNADDDMVGLVVGFATDDAGHEHTLNVTRSMGGSGPHFQVSKNYAWGFYNRYFELNTLPLNSYQNGENTNGRAGTDGWNGKKTKVKVVRNGDLISIECTDAYDGTTGKTEADCPYLPESQFTLDLSAHPELEMFRGPSRTGYVCLSQLASTWSVISRPGTRKDFVDVRDMTLWRHDGNDWVQYNEAVMADVLGRNKFLLNLDSKKLFYYPLRGPVYKVREWANSKQL